MDDHTLDPPAGAKATRRVLASPLACDAKTKNVKHFYRYKASRDSTTVEFQGPGNIYSGSKAKRRGRHPARAVRPGSLSPPGKFFTAGAIASKSWTVPARIWGQKIRFLVDSGSDVTIIPSDRYRAIPSRFRPALVPLGVPVLGASGHPLCVMGTCQLPIAVGNDIINVDCTVVDGGICPILGMNFMREQEVAIDFGSGEMRFGKSIVCLSGPRPPKAFAVEVALDVEIPAQQEAVVMVQPKGATKRNIRPQLFTGLICASNSFVTDTGLVAGRTLVKSDPRAMPVLLINPNPYPVRVDGGSLLGNLLPVDSFEASDIGSKMVGNHELVESQASTKNLSPEIDSLPLGKDLTKDQRVDVKELLTQYQDIFSVTGNKLGRTSTVQHTIDVGSNPPIRQRARRIPAAQQPVYEQEMAKMKELDIIEPSDSPWASPTVLVRKKDGTMRFCVDYRRLNNATVKDSYPLPNIEDTFDSLSGAKYFCALDLASGYWQVEMAPKDRHKTAFLTREGLWQFKVMPFGLCNAPATFERLMEMILRGLLWKRCLVYIDDIIVYGKSFEETLQNLQTVFQRIRDAGLKLKPKKCELFTKEILYLGFRVNGDGVKPDPGKIEAVTQWPLPCNATDVRSFLGFANYHRRFIKNFAQIAKPLQLLTHKGQRFSWGSSQRLAFSKLKFLLTTCPMLNHPLPDTPFILDTDASAFALGGVLSQKVNGVEKVIAYASNSLSKSEMNYCTTHRELLAVIRMTAKFRHYLWGRKFHLRTDHASLRWLLNYRDADGMLARWLAKLQAFDFTIEHRPGVQHGNADGLSRCKKCKNSTCTGLFKPEEVSQTSSDTEFDVAAVKVHLEHEAGKEPVHAPDGTGVGSQGVARTLVRINSCNDGVDWSRRNGSGPAPDQHTDLPDGTAKAQLPMLLTRRHLTPGRLARVRKLDKQLSNIWLPGFGSEDLKAAQTQDPDISPVLTWYQAGRKPDRMELAPCSAATKNIVVQWPLLRLRNGILHREAKRKATGEIFYQFVVPLALRNLILEPLHNLCIVGHLGIARTLARVQERYYWPCLATDVARWCASCSDCAARKGKPPPKRVPLCPLPVGEPFERIALDILDTHIPTKRGNVYILVISDYFSKYTDAYPLRRKTAYNCAKTLMEKWVVFHGVPTVIHSDQGREFEGHVFQRLAQLLGATKTRTAPYRPQSDGLVERFNRTLLNMLSVFIGDRPGDWDETLPFLLSAYRSSVHASTQCTPNSLVYGRETNLPIDLLLPGSPQSDRKATNYPDYVQFVRKSLQSAHSFARAHMGKALVRQKRNYDVNAKSRSSFKKGDLIRYYYVPEKNRHKFACPWLGPYKVIDKLTEVDYRIEKLAGKPDSRVVHVDHLKPYEKDFEPSVVEVALPPLILDEDYLDLVPDKDHEDYLEFLEPFLDNQSESLQNSASDPQAAIRIPTYCPGELRRSTRLVKPPRRYGFSSNPVVTESIYWF